MPIYNAEDAAKLKHIASLAEKTSGAITALDAKTFGSLGVSQDGKSVSFYASTDGTGTALATFDFPEELYLAQTGTQIVADFTFSQATYPGATDPNLNGKTVLILAVQGNATNPTVKYSFVDMAKVIKAVTAGDNSITVNGYAISVKVSAATGNLIEVKEDGVFVGSDDSKVDKVTGAVSGNVVNFGASGAIVDSGVTLDSKVDKVTSAVTGNIVTFGANGALVDSGVKFASDTDVAAMLEEYFPSGS